MPEQSAHDAALKAVFVALRRELSMLFRKMTSGKNAVAELSTDSDLRGMMKTPRVLFVLFHVLACLFGLLAVSIVILELTQWASDFSMQDVMNVGLSVMGLIVYAVIFIIAGFIFKDISQGESPFTMRQARRIRIVAWLLLIYAVIEAVLPAGVIVDNSYPGATININHVEPSTPIIKVGSVIVGVVFYFLSSVFSYGVKLQELSDETL